MLKKRIIDEVKMIIAGRKVLKSLRTNIHIKEAMIDRYYALMLQAVKLIEKSMTKWYYRALYKKKPKVYMATLYLETINILKPA